EVGGDGRTQPTGDEGRVVRCHEAGKRVGPASPGGAEDVDGPTGDQRKAEPGVAGEPGEVVGAASGCGGTSGRDPRDGKRFGPADDRRSGSESGEVSVGWGTFLVGGSLPWAERVGGGIQQRSIAERERVRATASGADRQRGGQGERHGIRSALQADPWAGREEAQSGDLGSGPSSTASDLEDPA